jgi:hypothetical protein
MQYKCFIAGHYTNRFIVVLVIRSRIDRERHVLRDIFVKLGIKLAGAHVIKTYPRASGTILINPSKIQQQLFLTQEFNLKSKVTLEILDFSFTFLHFTSMKVKHRSDFSTRPGNLLTHKRINFNTQ